MYKVGIGVAFSVVVSFVVHQRFLDFLQFLLLFLLFPALYLRATKTKLKLCFFVFQFERETRFRCTKPILRISED
jgi:hypothetical protein